ncbi:MAG: transcription termination/antitermination protein NusG [bacterium]
MNTKWYVVRIVAGKEKKALEQLEYEVRSRGFSDMVKQMIIPLEKTFHIRQGKRVTVEKNHFPGYILVEAHPNAIGELKGIHKTANFVVGFLGGDNPTPLRDDEIKRILNKMDEMKSSDEPTEVKFKVGEMVNIVDGPFNSFAGTVKEVNNDKQKIKLDVKIFGRNTPLELSFSQVECIY